MLSLDRARLQTSLKGFRAHCDGEAVYVVDLESFFKVQEEIEGGRRFDIGIESRDWNSSYRLDGLLGLQTNHRKHGARAGQVDRDSGLMAAEKSNGQANSQSIAAVGGPRK